MNNIEKVKNIKTQEELKELLNTDLALKEQFARAFLGDEIFENLINCGADLKALSFDFE